MSIATMTPETTRHVLHEACSIAGVDPSGASLMRLGENALYRLDRPARVARVGRSLDAARKEVRVSRWLAENGLPAAHIAELDQPIVVDGIPVTFWEFIAESTEPITPPDLGRVLRDLHHLPVPGDLALPEFSPMPKIAGRLDAIGDRLPRDDRDFLHERFHELDDQFTDVRFDLGVGPVHGDAHDANLMRDRSGAVRLIDFEDFCWGPREWDVCVQAVRYEGLGWVSDEDYEAYVRAYGWNPLEWDGYATVRAIRELNMTTWLAQLLGTSDEIDTEVHKRISDLRQGQFSRDWRTF